MFTQAEETYLKNLVEAKMARNAYNKKVAEMEAKLVQEEKTYNEKVNAIRALYNPKIQTLQDALTLAEGLLEK